MAKRPKSKPLRFKYRRPPLYPYQLNALFHNERIGCIEASTKSGKTHAAIPWLFEQALLDGGPGKHFWWVAPVYGQARIGHERLRDRFLARSSFANYYRDKFQYGSPTLILRNGSTIWFKSAEKPNNLRGEDVHAAVVDEASLVRDESWQMLRSTLSFTRGPVRLIGNVHGRKNWFYVQSRRAESGEPGMHYAKVTAYDAIRVGLLHADEIADAKRDLPDAVFKELYLAIPTEDGSNPFGIQAIRRQIRAQSDAPAVTFGIDLGKVVDFNVTIGLDVDRVVSEFDRWQGVSWPLSEERILGNVGHTPTLVDQTGIGNPVLDHLQKARPRIFEGFVFNQQSKQWLMEDLAVSIQKGEVWYPKGPRGVLVQELEDFRYSHTRAGGVRYEAAEGLHDDCVIALALANFHHRKHKSRIGWRIL